MNVSLSKIFKIFFLIGLQLLGGGYVIMPLLKKYLVIDNKWLKEEDLIDYLALSQCLPGLIALNITIFSEKLIASASNKNKSKNTKSTSKFCIQTYALLSSKNEFKKLTFSKFLHTNLNLFFNISFGEINIKFIIIILSFFLYKTRIHNK